MNTIEIWNFQNMMNGGSIDGSFLLLVLLPIIIVMGIIGFLCYDDAFLRVREDTAKVVRKEIVHKEAKDVHEVDAQYRHVEAHDCPTLIVNLKEWNLEIENVDPAFYESVQPGTTTLKVRYTITRKSKRICILSYS